MLYIAQQPEGPAVVSTFGVMAREGEDKEGVHRHEDRKVKTLEEHDTG